MTKQATVTLSSRRDNGDLSSRTQASVLTDAVRQDIIQGVFPPDSRLKLRELSERYEVGVIPLREALSRLAMSGFVEVEDQRGFRVASTSETELLDITQIRQRIETDALRDSILHGDLDWEIGLQSAFYRLGRIPLRDHAHGDGINREWEKAHEAFHVALLAGCRSKWLLKLSAILREQTARYRHLSVQAAKSVARDVQQEHQSIVDAALAREVEKACRLLSDHFAATTSLVLNDQDSR